MPAAYHTQINDVLLTALAHTLPIGRARFLLIDLEATGAKGSWRPSTCPARWGGSPAASRCSLSWRRSCLGEALQLLKEQLRRIPHRGIGYGMLRYLSGNTAIAERLQTLPQPEVSFNYLGQFDQVLPAASPFTWAQEASGPVAAARAPTHLLAVNGCITAGRLQLEWTYSENLHRRATIECLAQDCMTALRVLIADCQFLRRGIAYRPTSLRPI